MSRAEHAAHIQHIDSMARYAPPDHQGTVNVRLVDKSFCGRFEMNLGTVAPGGEAEPHLHDTEHQIMFVVAGECDVTLGDDDAVRCGPGTVVRIPPKLLHRVVAVGERALEAIIVYSPPLGPRDERPVE